MSGSSKTTDVEGMMRRLVGAVDPEKVAAMRQRWSSTPLRIGTVCSGTDAPILALKQLLATVNEHDTVHNIKMEHVFSCENAKFKREFIVETSNPPLLFNDVVELASGRGVCHDGKTRDVPSNFDVLVAGTECVDFSSLSKSPKGLKGGGRSDITFSATLDLAKRFEPAIVVLENVSKCPADEMTKAFAEAGYSGTHVRVCTSDFMLPQSRNRAYFVFLHISKARFISSCFNDKSHAWVAAMQRLGPRRKMADGEKRLSWTDCLGKDDTATTATKKKGGRGKPFSESLESKWLAEIKAIEQKEGLTPYNAPGGRPYSDATKNSPAIANLPDRAKMRLDVQCKRAVKAGIDPFTVPLLWSPGQQLRFTDAGFDANGKPRPIAPCVTPKHEWIVSSRKGPLTGTEALALHGISVTETVREKFDCKQLRDLAGNAMTNSVVAAAFLATFLTVEFVAGNEQGKRPSKRSRTN